MHSWCIFRLFRKWQYFRDYSRIFASSNSRRQRPYITRFKEKDGFITDELLGDYDAWRNCGVSYWNENDGKRLSVHLKEAYEAPGGKELFWEQVPLHVFSGSYQVAIQPCSEQDAIEIDTYKELKSADTTYDL